MRRFLMIMTTVVIGCDGSSPAEPGINCPAIARPAIVVTPLDARSGETIRLVGIATATEGSYSDTTQNAPPTAPSFALAYERPGTYSLGVDIPGYARWELSKVVVSAGVCGVSTIPVAAQLHPK
jgi:hypothetical protein